MGHAEDGQREYELTPELEERRASVHRSIRAQVGELQVGALRERLARAFTRVQEIERHYLLCSENGEADAVMTVVEQIRRNLTGEAPLPEKSGLTLQEWTKPEPFRAR
jgi:hypothetical protein